MALSRTVIILSGFVTASDIFHITHGHLNHILICSSSRGSLMSSNHCHFHDPCRRKGLENIVTTLLRLCVVNKGGEHIKYNIHPAQSLERFHFHFKF